MSDPTFWDQSRLCQQISRWVLVSGCPPPRSSPACLGRPPSSRCDLYCSCWSQHHCYAGAIEIMGITATAAATGQLPLVSRDLVCFNNPRHLLQAAATPHQPASHTVPQPLAPAFWFASCRGTRRLAAWPVRQWAQWLADQSAHWLAKPCVLTVHTPLAQLHHATALAPQPASTLRRLRGGSCCCINNDVSCAFPPSCILAEQCTIPTACRSFDLRDLQIS
jgi:hypothetical protein